MSHRLKFIIIIGLQAVTLLGMVGYRHYPLISGQRVMLRVMPIDPRSLMSGDYVTLNYEISRLNLSKTPLLGGHIRKGGIVYVKVRKGDGGYYSPVGVCDEKPASGENEAVLQGRVEYSYLNELNVKYGIEAFFVEEGKGHEIESKTRTGQVFAMVAVTSGGKSALDKLIVDGRPFNN